MTLQRFRVRLLEGFELTAEQRARVERRHEDEPDDTHAMRIQTDGTFLVVRNVWASTEDGARHMVATAAGIDLQGLLVDPDDGDSSDSGYSWRKRIST